MAKTTTIDIPGKVSRLLTRSGNEITVKADQVLFPETEAMLIRFKLEGRVVGVALASQCSAWWVPDD